MTRKPLLETKRTTLLAHKLGRTGLLSLFACGLLTGCLAEWRAAKPKTQQQRASQFQQQSRRDSFETIYYKNGNLSIEAYLYMPEGKGPFPLVIYNHGSRSGQERT